jgi:hypothetical protein
MNATKRDRKEINKAARKLGGALHDLTQGGCLLTDHLPIVAISNLVEEHGFSADKLEGIYCGHKGRVNEDIGEGKFITITWDRAGDRQRFETITYIS